MAYATPDDMIAAYGEPEMIRLTAADGALDGPVDLERLDRALIDASAIIDGYLRSRHATPLAAPVPPEIARACRILARYDLSQGEQKAPSESATRDRKEIIDWLREIARGDVELDVAPAAATSPATGARVADRPALLTPGGPLQW